MWKTHQKKLLSRVCLGATLKLKEQNRNEEKEKNTNPSKLVPIPVDLEVEILTRLPAKSLMKFRCVSKTWSSIIQSQRFIDSYNAMYSTRRSQFIITFSNGAFSKDTDKGLFIFSSSREGKESSSLVAKLDVVVPSVTLHSGFTCASVHGLIACTWNGPFVICNPCTRKIIRLPWTRGYTTFGYDPVTNQFKVLTLLTSLHPEPEFMLHEVVTLGGAESPWTRNKLTTQPYVAISKNIYINGFVYSSAWTPTRHENPVIVCFDVRFERLSFIKAPRDVVYWESDSILIEYKGKLASIARHDPYEPFNSYDLWILEDVERHDWSKQTCKLPFSFGMGMHMTSPGTNRVGYIIFAPRSMSRNVEPFYIFYYNVATKDMRKVMLKGVAEEFRRRYGITEECWVNISPQHVERIAFL